MFGIEISGFDIYNCREALERPDDYTERELASDETARVAFSFLKTFANARDAC